MNQKICRRYGMDHTYKTAEIAHMAGIHPNTVRLYEANGLIPEPVRRPNGYRVFTDIHLEHIKLIRTALKIEIMQNGLRQEAIRIIKTAATGDFDQAIQLANGYLQQIKREQNIAEEAIVIAEMLLSGSIQDESSVMLKRKEAADCLNITIDTLRNWEMNGLLTVRRKHNGYRIYSDEDIRRLKIIRCLRCANYSLAAILRMLHALAGDPGINIRSVIDTPADSDDIISVCDKLLTSLFDAEKNACKMLIDLNNLKEKFSIQR